jgi:hypothetical protein
MYCAGGSEVENYMGHAGCCEYGDEPSLSYCRKILHHGVGCCFVFQTLEISPADVVFPKLTKCLFCVSDTRDIPC